MILGKARKDGLPNRIEFACLRHDAMYVAFRGPGAHTSQEHVIMHHDLRRFKFEEDSKTAESGKSSSGDDDTAMQLATLGFQVICVMPQS